ncbi:MAG: hypothetical protein MSH11_04890 [Ruminococcus sp.]|nr:hypothetical protein [Ruminococcus sp.]
MSGEFLVLAGILLVVIAISVIVVTQIIVFRKIKSIKKEREVIENEMS